MRDWGIFKELYNGSGIYWNGSYNLEGSGSYKTIAKARLASDISLATQKKREDEEILEGVKVGKYILCSRVGDTVTAHTPDGDKEYSIRHWRNSAVWETEEKYNMEVRYKR